MPMSNAEKQARFRKKEQLNKHVSQVSRDCRFIAGSKPYLGRTFGDLDARLREAAILPDGWTDADLERAYGRVRNIHGDVVGAVDFLAADVDAARDSLDPFIASSNPKKWLAEKEKAERDTIALAGHVISALNLSQLPNEERAAALVETLRYVGRSLANSASIGRSNATAVCLTAMNPHYERPEWFVDQLATWIGRNVDKNTRKSLGESLLEDDRELRR
jgi:hypothetical protein